MDTPETGKGCGPHEFTIRLPEHAEGCDQDEEWFFLEMAGSVRKVRIHDYAELYRVPDLYETLVYGVLRCRSHERLADVLRPVLEEHGVGERGASVLELGAGNGVVGDRLRDLGIGTVIGLDLLEEARAAAERDRPGVYDEYIVADLTKSNPLAGRSFDGLVVAAALGFGDIPTEAFIRAANQVRNGGWFAMTIKNDFLEPSDETGFGVMLRELLHGEFAELEAYQRFRHRVSIAGEDIFYAALVMRKLAAIPTSEELRSAAARRGQAGTVLVLPGAP